MLNRVYGQGCDSYPKHRGPYLVLDPISQPSVNNLQGGRRRLVGGIIGSTVGSNESSSIND